VAVNPALAAPAGTITVLGTVTVELLLDRFTVKPPFGVAAVSVTVQTSVPTPVIAPLLQDSRLNAAGGGVPVPLRLITAVPLVVELLVTVSWPVAAPVAAGSNCTLSVALWPGFNVTGKPIPDIEKPTPASAAELIVTGAVPVDVKVRDCVADVFTITLPKAMLFALMLSVGTAAFNCRVNLFEIPPELAVRVTACAVPTDETPAVNPALEAFTGTVTMAGTVTAALLLDKLRVSPPLGTDELSVTVQESVPDPVMELLLHVRTLNAAGTAVPVPLRVITVVVPVEELLLMLS
jgi:hypothetical protein